MLASSATCTFVQLAIKTFRPCKLSDNVTKKEGAELSLGSSVNEVYEFISTTTHKELDKAVKKIFDLFNEYPTEYEAGKLEQIITNYVERSNSGIAK